MKITWNMMWSFKCFAMLECESRTSLHAAQSKWQPGSVLMFCSYYFRMNSINTLFLCSVDSTPGFDRSLFLNFKVYTQNFRGVFIALLKPTLNDQIESDLLNLFKNGIKQL